MWGGGVIADIGAAAALSALDGLATDPDPDVVIYTQAAVQSLAALHFTSVQILIKPGSAPSPISLSAHGSIPVAILSTSKFNAPTSVQISSLTFGSTGTEKSLLICNSNGPDVNC